ncbi:MAG: anthranilate phosphoribosyltransferase [Rhodocyclales bacterium]|nr:anthranilate phosphoribosyltransferase [Rhodocyclales bacterium]
MIDNYDSFTYNLVQYFGELGEEVRVYRNDAITLKEIAAMQPARIVISPGPCAPAQAGISVAAIKEFAGRIPLLGVCLGHQAIGEAFGGRIVHAAKPMHGKISPVFHAERGLFRGLPTPLSATRYHSLAIERATLPDCLEITAWTDEGEIMGVRHKTLAVEGVQFHPESVMPEHGHDLLNGLRTKKETVGEIAAAAAVMRELCTRVEVPHNAHFVDVVGTGGDAARTFNISTACAFVAAAAGATVAKHGNRSVSSKSGAADVLEALGARIDLQAGQVAACIEAVGMGFMFAPNHHPAMKNVVPVRREMGVRTIFNILGPLTNPAGEMGVRTIFNILGPLTNPAGAPNTLMGVFHPDLVGIQVRVMQRLGADHVLVVWGKDGLDEVSLGAATLVGELKNGEVREYEIHPEDFGLQMVSNRGLKVADAAASKAMLIEALENKPGTPREIVALNAGTALYAANLTASIGDGILRAREVIASGAARAKLDEFVQCTQRV